MPPPPKLEEDPKPLVEEPPKILLAFVEAVPPKLDPLANGFLLGLSDEL